jgi:hypothetical protein
VTKTRHRFAGLIVALASCVIAGPALALNDHSWVSSTGTGTACTRAAPCASMATAHDVTNASGVISILDPGGSDVYGFTIKKSLTIRAEGIDGGATAIATGGVWIVVEAGPSDQVVLEGLHLSGGGIRYVSGGQLHVVKCVITNGNVPGTAGIRFQPSSAGRLSVTDTVITNFGSGTGGGILVNPQFDGTAQVALERVTVNGNAFGIAADGTASTGGINMTIADSMAAGNSQDGIIAVTQSGGAPIGVYVKNTKSANNAIGIRSIGPTVTVRVDGSSVIGNSTGLSFSGGGILATYGNNAVNANGINGAFSGSIPLQ